MTSSVARRLGGSYVIDEIFLNDIGDIIKDAVEFNQDVLTADVDAEVAKISYFKSPKDKDAAIKRTRALFASRYTLVDVTCTQKNGTVRHNLGFDSILSANKIDDRGLAAIEIKVGGSKNTRCLKIE
ncbi:hypothetical protein [Aquidulcibacter paucihalophilus]|uniref:hypothetical protein n=1 Tax=Aquidulcibacter paucihalophilus TaxID=1978549 RepID=UPI0012FF632E|nr:hypothetical protein [Aquidulcibacter paucihalophilus]